MLILNLNLKQATSSQRVSAWSVSVCEIIQFEMKIINNGAPHLCVHLFHSLYFIPIIIFPIFISMLN